ncbi:hypothetical protein MMC22_009859 [Lobaria immixta]|nr:hypothetical protein [Lobaria immixta]
MAAGSRIFFLLALGPGLYLTLILAVQNGTIGAIQGIKNDGYLPRTTKPLRRFYTGISPIDHQLSSLILFFWPIADAHLPTLTLFWVNFCGEMVIAWTLIMLEGMRKGYRGRLISNVVIIGLVMQNIAYAVVVPFMWAIHPSTSSLASPTFSFSSPRFCRGQQSTDLRLNGIRLSLTALDAPGSVGADARPEADSHGSVARFPVLSVNLSANPQKSFPHLVSNRE